MVSEKGVAVTGIWIVLPPWLYAVLISLLGHWGRTRWISHAASGESPWWENWGIILITNLVFMSLIPISLLSVIGGMLPFGGARAGLSLGLLAFLFGALPTRLLAATETGWDLTLWRILIDLLRVGGAMTIIGYLVI